MCRFIGFKQEGKEITAGFILGGRTQFLSKRATRRLHERNKKLPNPSGTNPKSEQTKFVLDRWPDTSLGIRIAKQRK